MNTMQPTSECSISWLAQQEPIGIRFEQQDIAQEHISLNHQAFFGACGV
jgi:hypothetical protein